MRNNSQDETLKRNYIQKYQYLIAEYEEVKAGKHPTFRSLGEGVLRGAWHLRADVFEIL